MIPNKLYRGMSDLELSCWILSSIIPKNVNFSSCPRDATEMGKKHLLEGELVIFEIDYEGLLFKATIPINENFSGWYETVDAFDFDTLQSEIFTPGQAVRLYQELEKYTKY